MEEQYIKEPMELKKYWIYERKGLIFTKYVMIDYLEDDIEGNVYVYFHKVDKFRKWTSSYQHRLPEEKFRKRYVLKCPDRRPEPPAGGSRIK